jgi:hypothetical protein
MPRLSATTINNQSSFTLLLVHNNTVKAWPFQSKVIEKGQTHCTFDVGSTHADATYKVGETNELVKFTLHGGIIHLLCITGPRLIEMAPFNVVKDHAGTIVIRDISRSHCAWMENKKDKTLCKLCIPGTHNSGASWAYTSHLFGRYFLCQDVTITDQLYDGIRFIDFRVSDNGIAICVSHRLVVTEFKTLLTEIAEFLMHQPTEICIIHIKKDWDRVFTKHEELHDVIEHVLGVLILRDSDNWSCKTIQELCDMGKRALVITDLLSGYVDIHNTMTGSWPSCHSTKPSELFCNFDNKWFYETRPRLACDRYGLSITDCIITPDVSSIFREIINLDVMLRDGAKICNEHIRTCMRDAWMNHFVNIVTMDFPDRETILLLINHENML